MYELDFILAPSGILSLCLSFCISDVKCVVTIQRGKLSLSISWVCVGDLFDFLSKAPS